MCGPRLISGAHEDFLLFDRTAIAIEVAIHWQSYTERRNDDDRFVNVLHAVIVPVEDMDRLATISAGIPADRW